MTYWCDTCDNGVAMTSAECKAHLKHSHGLVVDYVNGIAKPKHFLDGDGWYEEDWEIDLCGVKLTLIKNSK